MVIATRNRPSAFRRTLESLSAQPSHPAELVVVDGSDDDRTRDACLAPMTGLVSTVIYLEADQIGAATQRNQGVTAASHDVIWFCDDDILFEAECIPRLWAALGSDPRLGGVSAMIINQQYRPPGRGSRLLFQLLDRRRATYAGRCLGPGLNLLPEDRSDLPDVVPVEWLNTTCTVYRREALPDPPFDPFFRGYSLCEDLVLSLRVGQSWKLANARTARIFHDSQPGDHKRSAAALAEMELVNRHYVMTHVLGRVGLRDYFRLVTLQLFQLASGLRSATGRRRLPATIWGKLRGAAKVVSRISSGAR